MQRSDIHVDGRSPEHRPGEPYWQGLTLDVDGLEVARGGRTIFTGLGFQLTSGQGLELRGANGSGKSTLLRTVAGLIHPVGGTVRLEGGSDRLELTEQLHFIGHANGIKRSLSAFDNVAFWQRYLGGRSDPSGVTGALQAFALDGLSDVPAGIMSAGQQRRLGLARLVVVPRPIWLLDEPSVSLDHTSVGMLARLADAHIRAGGILVAATHVALGLTLLTQLDMERFAPDSPMFEPAEPESPDGGEPQ